MDLSTALLSLLASLGIPAVWLVPISGLLVIVLQKYLPNLKLPPVKPDAPPVPGPNPVPAPIFPNLADRPVLSLLLQLLALRSVGAFQDDDHALASILLKTPESLKKIEVPTESK